MITRVWHGKTSLQHADKYLKFLVTHGTQDYRRTKGNRSVRVWRNIATDACHFYTVTEWDDLEAIKAFAGENYARAVYYPEDQDMLLEFEETVQHFESFIV